VGFAGSLRGPTKMPYEKLFDYILSVIFDQCPGCWRADVSAFNRMYFFKGLAVQAISRKHKVSCTGIMTMICDSCAKTALQNSAQIDKNMARMVEEGMDPPEEAISLIDYPESEVLLYD